MPLFLDKTSGKYIHLGVEHGAHKLDDITKYNKKTFGKLILKKKDGTQIVISDLNDRTEIEKSLKFEGKTEE